MVIVYAPVAQGIERLPPEQKVAGSNPVFPIVIPKRRRWGYPQRRLFVLKLVVNPKRHDYNSGDAYSNWKRKDGAIMTGRLTGKVAIVTGAGSGMGKAISQLFAKEGAKVVLAEINAQGIEEVKQAIEQAGG